MAGIPDIALSKLPGKELYEFVKDKAAIQIGGLDDDSTAYPEAYSSKWDGECWLKISHKDRDKIPKGQKANLKTEKGSTVVEIDIPNTGRKHKIREGSLEWDIEYQSVNDLPADDIERFTLDFPYDQLTWHHQAELTQDEIDEGHSRPDNIINSYAGYFNKSNRVVDVDGNELSNYETGKFCHIFRPKLIAADNAETWVTQEIVDNELRVSVDRDWCIEHGFPVVLDPTVGYTSIGGSSTSLITSAIIASGYGVAPSNGTVTSISIYSNTTVSTVDLKIGIYSGTTPTDLIATESQYDNIGVLSVGWHQYAHTASVSSGTGYWNAFFYTGSTTGYFDSLGGTNRHYDNHTWADAWPSTFTSGSSSGAKYSIYFTYTESGGSLFPVSSTIFFNQAAQGDQL